MGSFHRFAARSDHPAARLIRRAYRSTRGFSLPAPRVLVLPVLWLYLFLRGVFYFLKRVLICEPFFKAYCKRYGRGLRTGVYIHWVQGKGDIIVGDDVEVDGKVNFIFGARFTDTPTLRVGDHTIIRHGSCFVVGKSITIGKYCLIAQDVSMFDSSGHPSDPESRRLRLPPSDDDVRPIVIGDNVWIGQRSIISPGVTIGDNSIVSAGSVVVANVPPNVVVAGFPARKVASLEAPRERTPEPVAS